MECGKNILNVILYEDCADSIKNWPREETLHESLEKLNLKNNPGKFTGRSYFLFRGKYFFSNLTLQPIEYFLT